MRISDWSSDVCSSDLLFESVFGLPYEQALWWGAAATILYTLVGGFHAVSWPDTLQAGLMFFALLLAPSIILMNNGGFEATVHVGREFEATRTDWFGGGPLGGVGVLSALTWGMGSFGPPPDRQRRC